MSENSDSEAEQQIDEELQAYLNASKISKNKFSKAFKEQVETDDFSWIGMAHLLAQEFDGEEHANPLHAYFPKKIIDAAKKFIKAEDLMDEYQSSLAIESTAIMNTDETEVSEMTDAEMNELLQNFKQETK